MRLLVDIQSIEWAKPGSDERENRTRKHALAAMLNDIANTVLNCGSDNGTIGREHLTGTFKITYETVEQKHGR